MREAISRRKLTDSRNLPTDSALGASPRKPEGLLRVDQDSDPDLLRCVTRAPVGRFSARGFESGAHRGGSNLPANHANSRVCERVKAYTSPWQKQTIIKSGGRKSWPGKRGKKKKSRSARPLKPVSRKHPSSRPLTRRPPRLSTRVRKAPPLSISRSPIRQAPPLARVRPAHEARST